MAEDAHHINPPEKRKVTVNLPCDLVADAEPRWVALGYGGFSAYLEQLIWQDLRDRPTHIRVREEPPEEIQHPPPPKEEQKKPSQTDKRIGFERKTHAVLALPLSFTAGVDAALALMQ
jgi:hypothetical protein